MKKTEGMISLSEIQINEEHWGEGSTYKVLDWLQSNYDPETMPKLQCVTTPGREGVWLLGWDNPNGPGLLPTIFGQEYADRQLARVNADIDLSKRLKDEKRGEYGMGEKP